MIEFAITPDRAANFNEAVLTLRKYLHQHPRLRSLIIGVSGGADSVLTLHLLAEAGKVFPDFRLYVAHANFSLRGEESRRDEEFVKELAKFYPSVKFFFKRFDTRDYANFNNISIEMAARELRHGWWDELRKEYDIAAIVTGHNANDNEETLLLNLLRGSSPRGLRAMKPLGDRIIRPLLGLYRNDILRILADVYASESKHLSPGNLKDFQSLLTRFPKGFVTDSTNLQSEYRRNFLRHKVLPMLRERWPGLDTSLLTTLTLQAEASDLIDKSVEDFLKKHDVRNRNEISWEALREFTAPITLIYHWLQPCGITTALAKEAAAHIPLHKNESEIEAAGRRWILKDSSELVTTKKNLRLIPGCYRQIDSEFDEPEYEEIPLNPQLSDIIRNASSHETYLPENPSNYFWRTPEPGDRIKLFPDKNGRQATKLVSDLLREAGVPSSHRDTIRMLVKKSSDDIVWIPGIRRSGADLIDFSAENEINHAIFHLFFKK